MIKHLLIKIEGFPRSFLIALGISLAVLLFTQCVHNDKDEKRVDQQPAFGQFAGDQVCASCHKNIGNSFIHTAHYLTSAPASGKTIRGSFAACKNIFTYDSVRRVVMEKRDSGFYQVLYDQGVEKTARRFDITIGSGTRGQTYLTWIGNTLYQLPVSYFTLTDSWSNSPGYLPHKINFDRPIASRCLECHSTFANTLSAPDAVPEKFDPEQVLFGVGCEKCHGPAANHVAFHTQNPKETKAKFIIDPTSLSRQQSLDLCALCHGGRLGKLRPSFQFTVGDSLSNYFLVDTNRPDPSGIDVHGNQYGLLRSSKCFRISGTMTCVTCHDPHANQRGQLALFSERCMGCHNTEHGNSCKMEEKLGSAIVQNCIDCHMPRRPSRLISVLLPGNIRPTAATIRSHFISIYPEETKKYLGGRNSSGKNHSSAMAN
ncbi:MAG TPA: multiheme c-type cytochrome [Puia sp.]|jgi:hypothetical protein